MADALTSRGTPTPSPSAPDPPASMRTAVLRRWDLPSSNGTLADPVSGAGAYESSLRLVTA